MCLSVTIYLCLPPAPTSAQPSILPLYRCPEWEPAVSTWLGGHPLKHGKPADSYTLKKTWLCLLQLPLASLPGMGPGAPPTSVLGLHLAWSCADDHSCHALMCIPTMLFPEVSSPSAISYSISSGSLWCSWALGWNVCYVAHPQWSSQLLTWVDFYKES